MTNLRKGRIDNLGHEKMLTIARAMGFPPAAWFEDMPASEPRPASVVGQDLAARVGHHFETVRHPSTGEPYTNAEVARLSVGVLTEETEGIRSDVTSDPSVSQGAALAGVSSGLSPHTCQSGAKPPLDRELVEALRDDTVREIVSDTSRLPERARCPILGIVRQFGDQQEPSDG